METLGYSRIEMRAELVEACRSVPFDWLGAHRGCALRRGSGHIRMRAELVEARGLRRRVMDPAAELGKPTALTTPALANDLRGDRDGRFLRRTRAKIKADRAGQPSELDFGEPCFTEPLEALFMGLP
jgi:hypothetical protein